MGLLKTGTESNFRLHPYERFSLALFGGADPDSSDASRQPGWFKELHNFRFETLGTPVTRTGIRRYVFRDDATTVPPTTPPSRIVPLMATEYAVWHATSGGPNDGKQTEYRYNVALIWENTGAVKLYLLDKRLRDGSRVVVTIVTGIMTEPTGCVMQFGDNLIVSLFDRGAYMAWPNAFPLTSATGQDWSVETLGKDVGPTPSTYDFPQTLTGDLLAFGAHRFQGGGDWVLEYDKTSATDPTIPILRLPISADYIRSGWVPAGGTIDPASQAIVATGLVPRWKVANKDVASATGTDAGRASVEHLQHRGYFYRFIRVRTVHDSSGSPIKLRSNPSAALFVPAVNFSPFFWSSSPDTEQGPLPSFPYKIRADLDQNQWNDGVVWSHTSGDDTDPDATQPTPVPSLTAMRTLQSKYRTYFNDGAATDQNGVNDALQWVAQWLGYSKADVPHNTDYNNQAPWKCDVSAQELTGAPQTVFRWADFPGLSATDTIEIYRTAYEDVDPEKRPVTTPLFKPHVYGLVGQIASGETFTDTVKIPDFGADPAFYNGYLRGQFSGDVVYDYGQSPSVVLGNIRADYRLLTPTPLVQAFLYKTTGQGAVPAKNVFTTSGPPGYTPSQDGYNIWQFFYAYEDMNGYRSAAVPIAVDTSGDTIANDGAIAFTFPIGYEPSVKSIVLYFTIWEPADANHPLGYRVYYRLPIVTPEPGTYTFLGANSAYSAVDLGAGILSGDTPKFYEPGAIIYSKPDSPWDWPQSQIEKHHASAPVRCLKEMMGELAVVTDESFTLTQLRRTAPRSERNTAEVGCITKHGHAKVDDAEVVMSQHGLYFLVPSRPEGLQSHMEIEVLPRLLENITGLLGLANMRRASMGYMARRRELWVHIPSSADLWPSVNNYPNERSQPHRTFIFNLTGGLRKMENYTFDISPDFEIQNLPGDDAHPITVPAVDRSTYNSARVLFSPGKDGTLYCCFTAKDGSLVTIDCDDPDTDYQGPAYGTIALGLLDPQGQKQIAGTEILLQARGEIAIVTGPPKITSGGVGGDTVGGKGWDAIRGPISDRAQVYTILKVRPDTPRAYRHPAIDRATETKGSTVMFRIRTQPDDLGRHRVELRALTILYDDKHQHA